MGETLQKISFVRAMNGSLLIMTQLRLILYSSCRIYVSSFLVIFHFGVGIMYIGLVTESVKDIIVYWLGYIDYKLVMLLLAPFIIAITMIKRLKSLVPLSVVANITVLTSKIINMRYKWTSFSRWFFHLIGLVMIAYYMLDTTTTMFSDLLMFNDYTYIPLYMGLVLLSHSSLGVVSFIFLFSRQMVSK